MLGSKMTQNMTSASALPGNSWRTNMIMVQNSTNALNFLSQQSRSRNSAAHLTPTKKRHKINQDCINKVNAEFAKPRQETFVLNGTGTVQINGIRQLSRNHKPLGSFLDGNGMRHSAPLQLLQVRGTHLLILSFFSTQFHLQANLCRLSLPLVYSSCMASVV
jgi:hypothetical protein